MVRTLAVVLMTVVLFTGGLAQAALINNGNGLIYDTGRDITWYDNPNYETGVYGAYETWATGLTAGGVTGWRLPTTPGTSTGYVNEGEMGHLFYDELGNSAGSFTKKGPFQNLNAPYLGFYTSKTYDGGNYYYFDFGNGGQYVANIGNYYFWIHGLAVHDGNIGAAVTPIAPSLVLFGSGLVGLLGLRRFRRS